MIELTGEELRDGNEQLGGIRIWFWIAAVLTAIGVIFNTIYIFSLPSLYKMYWQLGINMEQVVPIRTLTMFFILSIITGLIFVTLLIIALVGIKRRKPYTVPLGRAILVLTMLSVPVGTIIGAILWGRLRHPAAKKYLNYGV